MRRILIPLLGLAGLGGALAGCGDEDPTAIGSVLIGPGVTTFEVVLEAEDFLQSDTTYDGFGHIREAGFRLVANQFADEVDAHTLFQISRPFTVTYQVDGQTRTDSLEAIRGARVTVVVDTLAASDGPIDVEVLPVTESWDQQSVSWTLRYDTAGLSEAWTTPGGTTAGVAGMATWTAGDTLVIPIDSASAAVWQDTTAARLGALIRSTTPGSRLRLTSVGFAFDVVPRGNPDTLLTAGSATRSMHVVTPAEATPPTATELRVGGLPAWRSLLQFQPLGGLVLDGCGGGGLGTGDPECDVPLKDAALTLATLILEPSQVAGRRLERPLRIDARAVLTAANVPVFRSPLTTVGVMRDSVPIELFAPLPPPGATVAVPITGYVRELAVEDDPEDPLPLWLALVAAAERGTFGYAAFSSMESASPPRLRLVLTIPNQEIFP
ncbi:MAG: hypothetical protein KY466_11925 [Gemmatimonadetes bacterium]|nr:hypothetical protein [Gemmatimonadota bacterium]